MKKILFIIASIFLLTSSAYAHSGRLDGNGGHRVNKTWVFSHGRYILVKDGVKYLQAGEIQFNSGDYHFHVKPDRNGFKDGIYLPAENVLEAVNQGIAITESSVIASRNSDLYHSQDCRYIKNIKEVNAVIFKDKQEAEDNGYVADKKCNAGE